MNDLEKKVAAVRFRLRLFRLVDWAFWGILAGLGVLAVVMAVLKLFPNEAPYLEIGLAIVSAALAASIIGSLLRRVTLFEAAIKADQRLELRERLSSALLLNQMHRTESPAFAALEEDARRFALAMNPSRDFRYKVPRHARHTIWPAIAVIGLAFVPQLGLIGNPPPPPPGITTPATTTEPEEVRKENSERIRRLAEQAKAKEELLPEIAEELQLAEKLERLSKDLSMGNRDSKDAVAEMSRLNEELQIREREIDRRTQPFKQIQGLERAQETLDLKKALKDQDFEQAAKEMEALAQKIQQQSAEDLQQMAQEMKQLAEQLKENPEMSEAVEQAAQALEQMAAAKQQQQQAAQQQQQQQEQGEGSGEKNQQQTAQQQEQGEGSDPNPQQQQQQQQQQAGAGQQNQNAGQEQSEAGESGNQGQQQAANQQGAASGSEQSPGGQQGQEAAEAASAAMAQAAAQMSEMQQMMQQAQAIAELQKSMSECKGACMGGGSNPGQGNNPGQGQFAEGMPQNSGMGSGGPGTGEGGNVPFSNDDIVAFEDTFIKGQKNEGEIIAVFETEATAPRGESRIDYSRIPQSYEQVAADAITDQDIPVGMRNAVKDYFETINFGQRQEK